MTDELYIASVFLPTNGIDEDDATSLKTYDVCCVKTQSNGGSDYRDELVKFKYYHKHKPPVQFYRITFFNRLTLKNDALSIVEFFGRSEIYDMDTDQLYVV